MYVSRPWWAHTERDTDMKPCTNPSPSRRPMASLADRLDAMNLKIAQGICRDLGLRLTKEDAGDYRLAEETDREVSAYYTHDLNDAVDTAMNWNRIGGGK